MASKYKSPSEIELVAIYRLEFYKNQKNWKFCQDLCKKKPVRPVPVPEQVTKPVKRAKTFKSDLNKTYNLDEVEPLDLNKAFLEPDPDKILPVTPPDPINSPFVIDPHKTEPITPHQRPGSEQIWPDSEEEQKWPVSEQKRPESEKHWPKSELKWPEQENKWQEPNQQWSESQQQWLNTEQQSLESEQNWPESQQQSPKQEEKWQESQQQWPKSEQKWQELQQQWQESQQQWQESQQQWQESQQQWPEVKNWPETDRVWSVPEMPAQGWQNIRQEWGGEGAFYPQDGALRAYEPDRGWGEPCTEADVASTDQPETLLSAADNWLRGAPHPLQAQDFKDASLESVVSFMRGAALAPHSSEVDLNLSDSFEAPLSHSVAACLPQHALAAAVSRHATALRLLLREAHARDALQRSPLSQDGRPPSPFCDERPTRDIGLLSVAVASEARGRGRLQRERIIGIGMGRPYRL